MKKITGRMTAIAASLALTASAVSLSVYALNRKKGDVTGDGKITQADAVWAARKADGQDIGDVSFDELAADVDFNGKFDSADAQAIAKYVAGWNDTSVGNSITESDPVYTLSIKYRDDIDKSVQNAEFAAAIANDNDFITALSNDSELEEAVGESDELLELYLEEKYEELLILLLNEHEGVMDVILDGEFDDLSESTKFRGGLTLEEAYALALKFPDFNVDIDAGGEKAPMILTEGIEGYTNDENITSVTLTAKVAGGKAPYTYKWYKGDSEVGTNATYTSDVTGDNYDMEVYCLITDADGKTIQTNWTKLKNVPYLPLTVTDFTVVNPSDHYSIPVGVSSRSWDLPDYSKVTVSIDGGKAPYQYKWYINDEESYVDWNIRNGEHFTPKYWGSISGIHSPYNSLTLKYYVSNSEYVSYSGKTCKCVVYDSDGNRVETQPVLLRCTNEETSSLEHISGVVSNQTSVTYEDGNYNIEAYFKGGSQGWHRYNVSLKILKEYEDGTRYFSGYGTGSWSGIRNVPYDFIKKEDGTYCLRWRLEKVYLTDEGMIPSLNNCQIVLEDNLTHSTLSYLLTLN